MPSNRTLIFSTWNSSASPSKALKMVLRYRTTVSAGRRSLMAVKPTMSAKRMVALSKESAMWPPQGMALRRLAMDSGSMLSSSASTRSLSLRAVMSRTLPRKLCTSSVRISASESSMGKSEPSRRQPRSSRVEPSTLRWPVRRYAAM